MTNRRTIAIVAATAVTVLLGAGVAVIGTGNDDAEATSATLEAASTPPNRDPVQADDQAADCYFILPVPPVPLETGETSEEQLDVCHDAIEPGLLPPHEDATPKVVQAPSVTYPDWDAAATDADVTLYAPAWLPSDYTQRTIQGFRATPPTGEPGPVGWFLTTFSTHHSSVEPYDGIITLEQNPSSAARLSEQEQATLDARGVDYGQVDINGQTGWWVGAVVSKGDHEPRYDTGQTTLEWTSPSGTGLKLKGTGAELDQLLRIARSLEPIN